MGKSVTVHMSSIHSMSSLFSLSYTQLIDTSPIGLISTDTEDLTIFVHAIN